MIPKNLYECIDELKKVLSASDIEILKKDKNIIAKVHHTFGKGMRNAWGLWEDSELKRWFNSVGIFHPDDMSAIIMESLRRSVNDQPILLDEQVKYYQDYWKKYEDAKKQGEFYVQYSDGDCKIV